MEKIKENSLFKEIIGKIFTLGVEQGKERCKFKTDEAFEYFMKDKIDYVEILEEYVHDLLNFVEEKNLQIRQAKECHNDLVIDWKLLQKQLEDPKTKNKEPWILYNDLEIDWKTLKKNVEKENKKSVWDSSNNYFTPNSWGQIKIVPMSSSPPTWYTNYNNITPQIIPTKMLPTINTNGRLYDIDALQKATLDYQIKIDRDEKDKLKNEIYTSRSNCKTFW